MSTDSNEQMCLYRDLLPAEQSKLESIDKDISLFVIQKLKQSMRPIWIGMQTTDGRFVELRILGQEAPLCSIPEHVFEIMSASQIIEGFNSAYNAS